MSTTTAAAPPRDPELARLLERVERTNDRLRALTGPLGDAQLRWTPPSGGWGVGTVLEHLVVSHSMYVERIRGVLDEARAKQPPLGSPGPWKSTFIGRLITRAVSPDSRWKVPAPRVLKPGPEPRPRVLEGFLATQDALATLLRDADGYDLNRIRLSSPASALARMNLGDIFHLLTNHAERHLGQIERVMGEAGFPKG